MGASHGAPPASCERGGGAQCDDWGAHASIAHGGCDESVPAPVQRVKPASGVAAASATSATHFLEGLRHNPLLRKLLPKPQAQGADADVGGADSGGQTLESCCAVSAVAQDWQQPQQLSPQGSPAHTVRDSPRVRHIPSAGSMAAAIFAESCAVSRAEYGEHALRHPAAGPRTLEPFGDDGYAGDEETMRAANMAAELFNSVR